MDKKTYQIVENGTAIKCLRCDRTSYHPKDVEHLYCGHCHDGSKARQKIKMVFWVTNSIGRVTGSEAFMVKHESFKLRNRVQVPTDPFLKLKKEKRALTFHHRDPQTKQFGFALNQLWGTAWDKILDEFAKCDLLCIRCHMEVEDAEHPVNENSYRSIIEKMAK